MIQTTRVRWEWKCLCWATDRLVVEIFTFQPSFLSSLCLKTKTASFYSFNSILWESTSKQTPPSWSWSSPSSPSPPSLMTWWQCMKERRSPHHHPKLTVADLPVPVLVHRVDHLVDLLVRHLGSVFYISVKLLLHFRAILHDPVTLPGRWVNTNFSSSAVMHPSSSLLNTRNVSFNSLSYEMIGIKVFSGNVSHQLRAGVL